MFLSNVSIENKIYTLANILTCGEISPKITIAKVEQITATNPEVKSSNKIVKIEFTKTLENKIEHNK